MFAANMGLVTQLPFILSIASLDVANAAIQVIINGGLRPFYIPTRGNHVKPSYFVFAGLFGLIVVVSNNTMNPYIPGQGTLAVFLG